LYKKDGEKLKKHYQHRSNLSETAASRRSPKSLQAGRFSAAPIKPGIGRASAPTSAGATGYAFP
jgi:hypothetical protein